MQPLHQGSYPYHDAQFFSTMYVIIFSRLATADYLLTGKKDCLAIPAGTVLFYLYFIHYSLPDFCFI